MTGIVSSRKNADFSCMPIISIYRLPDSQYGYKGHVMNLPLDITAFATSLLRLPKHLDIFIVRRMVQTGLQSQTISGAASSPVAQASQQVLS